MKKFNCYLLIIILFFCFSGTVVAIDQNPNQLLREAPNQFYYPDKNAVVWKDEQVFDYSKQPYKVSHYKAIKIFNHQGVDKYSQVDINYHPQWQELNVTTAVIIKPSGKVITIAKDKIKDRPVQYTPNQKVYQSQQQRIIDFSQVEVGSLIIYAYQKEIKQLLLPEEIQISTTVDSHQSKVVLKLPQDRKVNTKIKPKNELNQAVINKQEQIKKYTWSGYKANGKILVSTLDSWQQFSTWYNSLITKQGQLNQQLKDKIVSLTKGLPTKQDKIKALYNYVADNIRHLDYKLGVNGYRPLAATEIYQNKYAVTKDKVYFLKVLLKEINVSAEAVLINRKDNFAAGIVVADFNQMLLYLPEQDLYLDPNSGFVRYGNLPLGNQGRRALGLARGSVKRIPILAKEKNQEQVQGQIDLDDNGTAQINLEIRPQGFYDYIAKALFGTLSSVGQREAAVNILKKHFANPQLNTAEITGVKTVEKLSDLRFNFIVEDYYQVQNNQVVIEPNQLPISFLLSVAEARNTLPCKIERQLVINLPEQYETVVLPSNKEFSNHEGKLSIKYQKKEKQIIIDFTYQFKRLAGVERVSWVYINDLLAKYKKIKQQKILLKRKNDI